ncbi:unnamed protein product [Lactuca saligna]|uniref:Uncharacterized protein n=1 Tax=Lactuca saligna TaxID=75948 RepID=A0AA36E9N4_LACSI|nr:unnamed protein product [Lactuca saligna]
MVKVKVKMEGEEIFGLLKTTSLLKWPPLIPFHSSQRVLEYSLTLLSFNAEDGKVKRGYFVQTWRSLLHSNELESFGMRSHSHFISVLAQGFNSNAGNICEAKWSQFSAIIKDNWSSQRTHRNLEKKLNDHILKSLFMNNQFWLTKTLSSRVIIRLHNLPHRLIPQGFKLCMLYASDVRQAPNVELLSLAASQPDFVSTWF